jgi:hypothetical protein
LEGERKKIKKKKEGEDPEDVVGDGVEMQRFAEVDNSLLGTRKKILKGNGTRLAW